MEDRAYVCQILEVECDGNRAKEMPVSTGYLTGYGSPKREKKKKNKNKKKKKCVE